MGSTGTILVAEDDAGVRGLLCAAWTSTVSSR